MKVSGRLTAIIYRNVTKKQEEKYGLKDRDFKD